MTDHNKNLEIISQNTLKNHIGSELTKLNLIRIKDELNRNINEYLSNHFVEGSNFPIEFNNKLGKWKIDANGNSFVQVNEIPEYIEVKITIKNDE